MKLFKIFIEREKNSWKISYQKLNTLTGKHSSVIIAGHIDLQDVTRSFSAIESVKNSVLMAI